MLILGCVGLITGCGGIGLIIAGRIRRRPRELREFLTALSLLDTEIVWGATPLPEAFASLEERVERPWQGFFGELKDRLLSGESAAMAWKGVVRAQSRQFALKLEDWQVIKDLGKGLGQSDRQQQHKQLELVQRQLALLQEQAGTWAEKQAKMWSYLGFLCGLAGVIILI
ncbi:MAG: stage III sporulation protein AB [Desulfitobacteriaceae bacterium]